MLTNNLKWFKLNLKLRKTQTTKKEENMKELSREEIIKKGKEYDKIQNEGGEGYNPYWSEIERRDMKAAQKEADLPKSKKEQIDALYRRIEIECGSIAREWNEGEVDKKKSELYAEINRLEKEIENEFKIEWTKEVTKTRRVEWNDFVKSIMSSNGEIEGKNKIKIYQRQDSQGWKMEDLKKAVKIHKL